VVSYQQPEQKLRLNQLRSVPVECNGIGAQSRILPGCLVSGPRLSVAASVRLWCPAVSTALGRVLPDRDQQERAGYTGIGPIRVCLELFDHKSGAGYGGYDFADRPETQRRLTEHAAIRVGIRDGRHT
jgi:hypothetical protein